MAGSISDVSAIDVVSVRQRVKSAVIAGLQLRMEPEDLADDESLFGSLGADSTAALEIVVAIEGEFGVEISDDDLTDQLLASVGSLSAYVISALGSQRAAVFAGADPTACAVNRRLAQDSEAPRERRPEPPKGLGAL